MQDKRPPEDRIEREYKGALESSYEREDQRWSYANQARDWRNLFIIAVIEVAWMLIVYFLEPGIR
jgi:hypothetical protein